jgi:hypothetical protein
MDEKTTNVDASKINNPFALSAVFLGVVETLLFLWFNRATDTTERIIVGSLMTLILLSVLFLIFKLAVNSNKNNQVTFPKALDEKVTPAKTEVSPEEIKVIKPNSEKISGPEGTYTIDSPPNNWRVKVVSLNGLIKENLEINDQDTIEDMFGTSENDPKNILLLKTGSMIDAIPIPGTTIINGVMIPTALITRLPIQLAIIPMERLQPPLYTENSFEHNVFNFIGGMIRQSLLKMQSQVSGKIKESGREFIQVEILQELEHIDISINDQMIKDCRRVLSHITTIAIKGDIIDHLLLMYYPTIEDKNIDAAFENDISTLKSLVSSFSPLKVTDPISMIARIKEKGRTNSNLILKQGGSNMFLTEFGVVMKKIRELNLNNSNDIQKAVKILKPFKKFSELVEEKDEELDALWVAVDNAENGNKQTLVEQIHNILLEMDSPDEIPQIPQE